MDTTAQEYLEFVVKLKGQEMEQGIQVMTARLVEFDKKAKTELDKVGAQFDRVAQRGQAMHTSLTTSLTGVEKLIRHLNAQMAQDESAAKFIQMLVDLGQASRYTATGVEKMTESLKVAGEAAPPDFDKLAEQAKRAGDETKKVGEETRKATENVKRGLGEQKRAAEENTKAGQAMGKGWSTSLREMEGAVTKATAAAAVGLAALSTAAGLSLNAFGDLQASANTLLAVAGSTNAELDAMTEKAMNFGRAGEALAINVQSAEVELARLGFTSKEVVESIDAIVYASQAAEAPLSQTGETVAGLVRGFGLEAKDAAFVADVLAESANKSALSLGTVQASMKYIAPVANTSNQQFAAMSAVLMELSNNMILGEQAGTSVRAMLDSLNNATPEAARLMNHLGLQTEDAQGKLRPLVDIFADLKVKMADYTDVAKSKMLSDIFGREAGSAAAVLLKANTATLKEYEKSLNNSAGASERTAKIIREGLNAELDKLKNKTNAAAAEIGNKLSPAVEGAVKFLNGMLDVVSKLPEPVKDTAIQVGGLAFAFTGLSIAMGGAVLGGGKLLGILGQLSNVGSKIGPWLAGLAGLATMTVGAPVVVGGIALGAGVGALYGYNSAQDQDKQNAAAIDNQTTITAKQNDAQGRINEALRKSDGGKSLNKLTREELAAFLKDAKEVKVSLDNTIKAERELADLRAKLQTAEELARGNEGGRDAQLYAAELSEKVNIKQKEIDDAAEKIKQAHSTMQRYQDLEKQFQTELDKRPKPKQGTQNAPDENAEREAEQKRVKAADEYFGKMSTARENLKLQWEQTAASMLAADSKLASSTEFGKKLTDSAENIATVVMKTSNRCLEGVNRAFYKATKEVLLYADSAYMAADKLAQDARFTETQWDRKATLPAGTVVVWDRSPDPSKRMRGKGWKHGHISIADGKGNELSDHKEKQMTEHYAGGAARVFIPKGASMAGIDTNLQKDIQQQEILNKLLAQYNQDLAAGIAYRDKLKVGSDAWKKADEEVTKMQQEAAKIGIDLTNNQRELEKKLAEDRRAWAREQLDIESAIAEARARMTLDTLDDIKAAHLRTMNELKVAEAERLAKEGTTQEQRKQIESLYKVKRLAAEKDYQTQLKNYDRERFEFSQNLETQLSQLRLSLMADSLEKTLASIELEKQTKLKALEEAERKERERWASQPHNYREGTWDDQYEAYLFEQQGQAINDEALKRTSEAIRRQRNQEAMQAINNRFAELDLNQREWSQGESNPETLETIQIDVLEQRLLLQKSMTAELNQQHAEAKEGSDEAEAAMQKIIASKRTERAIELDLRDLVFARLDRELQQRREINQETLRGLGAVLESLAKMGNLQEGLGQGVSGWLGNLEGILNKLKTQDGKGLDLMGLLTGKGDLGAALTNTFGVQAAAKGPMAALSGSAITGIAGALPVVGQAIGVASSLGLTFPQLMSGATEFFFGDPLAMVEQAEQHKTNMLRLDAEIADSRLEMARARGDDTYELEKEQLQRQAELQNRALDDQERQLKGKRGFLGLAPSPAEQREIDRFEEEAAVRRLQINENLQARLAEMERTSLRERSETELAIAQQTAEARFNIQQNNAALGPGMADDIEAERSRRRAQAENVFQQRMGKIYKQQQDTGFFDQEAADAAVNEQKATLATIEHDLKMKGHQEEARITQFLASIEDASTNRSLKGLEKELALIDQKYEAEKRVIDLKLLDPTLDPREAQGLRDQLEQIGLDRDEQKRVKRVLDGNASRLAPLDLAIEQATGTQTKADDALANYRRQLEEISQAEAQAREDFTGERLTTELERLATRRINLERETSKTLKQIWADEYSERLNQQKTLIQEQLQLDSRRFEENIRMAEDRMRPIQEELRKLQREIDELERKRETEKRPYQAGDGKRNTKWTVDLAALDPTSYTEAGTKEIANMATHTAATVSGATQREGLLKEAELMELEATNQVTDERITEAEYKGQMQKAQLLRAKAAEMELATADLTRTRKLELEKEWAEAYANWQKFATEAIDARYDAENQRIQDNIDLRELQLQQQQDIIDEAQKQLDALSRAAEDKIRPIDNELLRVSQSTRDWASQWGNVTAGIKQAREEWERAKASGINAFVAAGNGQGSSGSIDRKSSKDENNGYILNGGDGYFYRTTSDILKAQKLGMADGGFIPDTANFAGDRFGPVWLDRKEAVIPFERWPEILRPFMPKQSSNSMVFSPNITITGNQIIGEFDMYSTARQAAEDVWRSNNDLFAINAGRLF